MFGYTLDDQSFQTNAYSDVSNLAVAIEANTSYSITAYIGFLTGATPDIKFTMSAPVGSIGHWSAYPQNQLATGSIGHIEALRLTDFTDAQQQGAAGSGSFSSALMCMPRGFVRTGAQGGSIQFRFAQITTDASQTTIVAGSWVRVMEIDEFAIA
jgi:hypothetical protein